MNELIRLYVPYLIGGIALCLAGLYVIFIFRPRHKEVMGGRFYRLLSGNGVFLLGLYLLAHSGFVPLGIVAQQWIFAGMFFSFLTAHIAQISAARSPNAPPKSEQHERERIGRR